MLIRWPGVMIAVASLIWSAQPVSAQALWQNATVGDTPAAVLSKFEGAINSNDPEKDKLGDGSQCLVRIEHIELVGKPYRVCFYFVKSKLTQVSLGLQESLKGYSAELHYDRVVQALISKYGERSSVGRDHGMMVMFTDDWYREGMNVSAIMIYVGRDGPAVINLNYQIRIAKEADKL
jgi:hypothetical protein